METKHCPKTEKPAPASLIFQSVSLLIQYNIFILTFQWIIPETVEMPGRFNAVKANRQIKSLKLNQ